MFDRFCKVVHLAMLGAFTLNVLPISQAFGNYQQPQDYYPPNQNYYSQNVSNYQPDYYPQNQQPYYPQDQSFYAYPCDPVWQQDSYPVQETASCGCSSGFRSVAAAVVLGAAAGAGAGAAASGGRGPRGEDGASGATFPRDEGQTLVFSQVLTAAVGVLGSSVIGFVSAPDGTVFETAPISLILGVNPIPPITIPNPQFGTYTVGLQITSGLVAVGATVLSTVSASRDSSITIVADAIPALGLLGSQSQTSAEFTYSPGNVP